MRIHHYIFLTAVTLTSGFQSLVAEDKSDLILEELKRLRGSIERLEQRVINLENNTPPAGPPVMSAGSGNTATAATVPDDSNLIGRVMSAITSRDEAVQYPWFEASLWAKIKDEMSAEEVKSILGEPTLEEPSLHPRRDLVYTYRGRRVATGKLVTGKVKFWRDKVVVIEMPDLTD